MISNLFRDAKINYKIENSPRPTIFIKSEMDRYTRKYTEAIYMARDTVNNPSVILDGLSRVDDSLLRRIGRIEGDSILNIICELAHRYNVSISYQDGHIFIMTIYIKYMEVRVGMVVERTMREDDLNDVRTHHRLMDHLLWMSDNYIWEGPSLEGGPLMFERTYWKDAISDYAFDQHRIYHFRMTDLIDSSSRGELYVANIRYWEDFNEKYELMRIREMAEKIY